MAQLKIADLKFDHIAVLVNDIERTVDFYSKAFGLKFEDIAEHQLPPDVLYKGKSSPFTMKVTFAQMGPLRLELVQVVEGECLYSDILKQQGEGFLHLGFEAADLEKEVANAEEQGLEMISHLKMVGIMAFAHFAPDKTSGVRIELVQENVREKIMAKLAEQS